MQPADWGVYAVLAGENKSVRGLGAARELREADPESAREVAKKVEGVRNAATEGSGADDKPKRGRVSARVGAEVAEFCDKLSEPEILQVQSNESMKNVS